MLKIKPKSTSFGLLDEYAELLIMIMKYMEKFGRVSDAKLLLNDEWHYSESRKKKEAKKKGKKKSLRDSSDDPLMSGSDEDDDEEAAEDSAEDSSDGEQGWNFGDISPTTL